MSINYNFETETVFSRSLRLHEPDDMVLKLLEDLVHKDLNFLEEEMNDALNVAICRPTVTVAKKLIQLGADVNYQDENEWTPLHCAIDASNLEAIFMLLYYNVDVTVSCDNMNPLFRAIYYKRLDILNILLDYYFEEPYYVQAVLFLTTLVLPTSFNTEFKRFVDFPDNIRWNDICCYLTSIYNVEQTLEMQFPLADYTTIVHMTQFIFQHVSSRFCELRSFIRYLYAMLNTPLAYDLGNLYKKQLPMFLDDKQFIQGLFRYYHKTQIKEYSLTTVLYVCMSLGMEILPHDFTIAYYLFGYGEELEAIIFAGNIQWPTDGYEIHFPIPAHIAFFETTLNLEHLFNFLLTVPHEPEVLQTLEYVTVPASVKSEMAQKALKCKDQNTLHKLERLPVIPTLVELCRSEVRRRLILTRRYKRVYEYLDAIRVLQLPKTLQDIILFKKGLY